MGIEDHPAYRAREARRLKELLEADLETLRPKTPKTMGELPRYEGGCLVVSQDPYTVICQVNEGAVE